MKVVFVHLGRENLGIEYLSAVLKNAGHETCLAYDPGLFGPEDNVFYVPLLERLFSRREKVIAEIEKSASGLAAFSVYTSTYAWARDIARIVKQRLGVKTVFGGPHATLVPERVIREDCVDFVIEGEGEFALRDLAQALSLKKPADAIENLWYKKDGRVIRNRLRPPVEDIDLLPLPDKELFAGYVNYRDDYMTMTGRGCVFNCSYCCESFINRLYGYKFYRKRSVEPVIRELSAMKARYGFKEVMFFDALFFTDKQWLKSFLERYKREIAVPYRCLGKINYFDRQAAGLLKESGCYCVDFGMQTFNEPLKREVLNRSETNRRAAEVFRLCDRLKLRYDIDHMFGLPGESRKDHVAAAATYGKLKYLNRVKCFELTYFPKLPILESARRAGLLDERVVAEVENGKVGDFFHQGRSGRQSAQGANREFKALFKILPLLPAAWVRYILKMRLYRALRFMPSFMIVFLQALVALRGRDYRFLFYLKYYLLRIRRGIAGK